MSRQIQIRRGTATEHSTFTGALGEVTMDTTNKTLRVHDGQTPGGIPLAKQSEIPEPYTMPENYDFVVACQLPTAENNYTWYRKYKSGWVEQGGITTNATIVFPTAFTTTNYTIICTPVMINANAGNISICYGSKTTTGMAVQIRWNGSGTNGERCWYVCGH